MNKRVTVVGEARNAQELAASIRMMGYFALAAGRRIYMRVQDAKIIIAAMG